MALKQFAKKEDIPAELAADAIELAGGKWAVFDTSDLEARIADAEEKRVAAEKLSTGFKRENEKMKRQLADKDSGVDAEKLEAIRAEVKAEFDPIAAENEQLKATNRTLSLTTGVRAIATRNGVIAEREEQWMKLHADKFDLSADGKPIVKGKPGADVAKFIANDVKKETPYLYQGTQANGGGTGGMQGLGGGAPAGMTFDDLMKNPTQALGTQKAAV